MCIRDRFIVGLGRLALSTDLWIAMRESNKQPWLKNWSIVLFWASVLCMLLEPSLAAVLCVYKCQGEV